MSLKIKRANTRFHIETDRKPHKKSRDNPVYVDEYIHPPMRIWMKYDSPERDMCEGYFMMDRGNTGPFEKVFFKHFEYGWVSIWERSIGNQDAIEAFYRFCDTNGILWL